MRTVILVLVGIVIVAGLIYIFNQPDTGHVDQDEESDTEVSDTDGLMTYSTTLGDDGTAELALELMRPSTTTVNKVQNSIIELKYIGPNSEPATEITDGFYASLHFSESDNLMSYAEAQDPVAEVSSTTFNGQPAISFATESALGTDPNTHIAYRLPEADRWIVDITYSTHGSRSEEYERTLFEILTTLHVTPVSSSPMTTLTIAMLDYDGIPPESSGPARGCDRVVFVTETVPETTMPLTAALNQLFSYSATEVEGWQNFIAETNDTLAFASATVADGTASIYLTGELSSLGGVCDNPRARIQIEETALQFDTVDEVTLYLNGEVTDLQPTGRGE